MIKSEAFGACHRETLRALLKALGPEWKVVCTGTLKTPERAGEDSPVFALKRTGGNSFDGGSLYCYGMSEEKLLSGFVDRLSRGRSEGWHVGWGIPAFLESGSVEELRLKLAVNGFLENPESRHANSF